MQPELTVAIVTHHGRDRLPRALQSLVEQTADPSRFEVVVVANGEDDGTLSFVESERVTYPFSLRVLHSPVAGFARARNLALGAANGKYLVWLDDDDWLSRRHVEVTLDYAAPGVVVMSAMADVPDDVDDPTPDVWNYVNRGVLGFAGWPATLSDLHTAGAYDAGKVVATERARSLAYDATLSSGADVVYWTELIARYSLRLVVPPIEVIPVYYRTVRTGSVSRRVDEQFYEDRLRCLRSLERVKGAYPVFAPAVSRLQGGQAANLGTWLRDQPEHRDEVLARIEGLKLPGFAYSEFNHACADKLVAAYAFPPALDTSGLVAARRLLLAGEPYDLVSNSMAGLRKNDPSVGVFVRKDLGRRYTHPEKAVSAHLPAIERFSSGAMEHFAPRVAQRGPYAELYSRAMWPAAHVFGALWKSRYPETKWVAEFSDPMRVDVAGRERVAPLPETPSVQLISRAVRDRGFELDCTNFYSWVEAITYALADEVHFTAELQRDIMLEHSQTPELAERALARSHVSPHPTLPSEYYRLVQTEYALSPDVINIGYFGVFYSTRGVGDLVAALRSLPPSTRSALRLHIFTPDTNSVSEEIRLAGVSDCIIVSEQVPYLEFLNLATKMDWLVVADARVAALHGGRNPYMPSKYSDYRGAGSRIWAIAEPGSTLSKAASDLTTELGDSDAAREALKLIVGR